MKLLHFIRHIVFIMLVFTFALSIVPGTVLSVSAKTKTKTYTVQTKGKTDITAQLQKELDRARKGKSKTVYKIIIPAGTYKISKQLKLYSNTHISMKNVTLIRNFSSADDKNRHSMVRLKRLTAEWNAVKGYEKYKGARNITFEGGVWDCSAVDGAQIIRIGHAQDLKFKNVIFTNVKNAHHMELAACKNVEFTGCTFSNFSGSWESNSNYEALQFDIMRSEHFPTYASYDETPCRNITVKNCTFEKLQRGIGSHSAVAGSYFKEINIKKCRFSDITGYAVTAFNYIDSEISGNTITNCGAGIYFCTMSSINKNMYAPITKSKFSVKKDTNSVIKNNAIIIKETDYQKTNYGIALYGKNVKKIINVKDPTGPYYIPKGDYRVGGVTVKGNMIILNCEGYGITLRGARNSIITGNIIGLSYKGAKEDNGIHEKGNTEIQTTKNRIIVK